MKSTTSAKTTHFSINSTETFIDADAFCGSGETLRDIKQQVIHVFRDDQSSPQKNYQFIRNLKNTKRLDLLLDGQRVELPDEIIDGMIWYFQNESSLLSYNDKKDPTTWWPLGFDCFSFVHLLARIPYNPAQLNWAIWHDMSVMEYNDDRSWKPWDFAFSIAWSNTSWWETRHASVYVGKGIFLGKAWSNWNLSCMTMSEMNRIFSTPYTVKVTPKNDVEKLDLRAVSGREDLLVSGKN